MGQPHLPGSGDWLDRHPLGSMASQAVQGPAWLSESVPHEDSCDALAADASHQCRCAHPTCVGNAGYRMIGRSLCGSAPTTYLLLQCVSPLLAQSGHTEMSALCPLLGVKRTSNAQIEFSLLTRSGRNQP